MEKAHFKMVIQTEVNGLVSLQALSCPGDQCGFQLIDLIAIGVM